ncbi:IDEAL domain-containing protein [Virgibacillus sp. C22-A2]|uniref:IDEAL domain-containing protein n=1 Tax=Virgibacillus tibetensis TaxID=3042313 RepID=A0ABU6KCM0_9BACI|nr:IDEAL domain-containing protein [Virgibacillus sp. C22-A2]
MLTVKTLKAYRIKVDIDYIYLSVSPPYFTILIEGDEYQFLPIEDKVIKLNRTSKKIENLNAKFAFQKDDEIIYITMTELISMSDFLNQLYLIAKDYYYQNTMEYTAPEIKCIVDELEHLNIKRMIDRALDNRDEAAFYTLLKLL